MTASMTPRKQHHVIASTPQAMMSSVLVDTTTLVDVQSTLEDYSNDPSQAAKVIERLQQLLRPYKVNYFL